VLGGAVGPALGGALTEAFSWQAMFAQQAPVAPLGAASYGPTPIADPCAARARPQGVGRTQLTLLAAVDGAACKLRLPREDMLPTLADRRPSAGRRRRRARRRAPCRRRPRAARGRAERAGGDRAAVRVAGRRRESPDRPPARRLTPAARGRGVRQRPNAPRMLAAVAAFPTNPRPSISSVVRSIE
jgi:MFS family permease